MFHADNHLLNWLLQKYVLNVKEMEVSKRRYILHVVTFIICVHVIKTIPHTHPSPPRTRCQLATLPSGRKCCTFHRRGQSCRREPTREDGWRALMESRKRVIIIGEDAWILMGSLINYIHIFHRILLKQSITMVLILSNFWLHDLHPSTVPILYLLHLSN